MWRERGFVTLFVALIASGILIAAEGRPSDEYEIRDVTVNNTMARQGTEETGGGGGFWANRRPCSCGNQKCGCCTGAIFPLPEFLRQRACMNLTYFEDEFAVRMAISFNNAVLYNNKVSGRNPRPVCVSPPRIPRAQLCVKLHDVFLIERNMHACLNVEGLFNKQKLFGGTMGCMRMGANGFAIVRPEDGGGLPSVEPEDPNEGEPDDDYDYDQVDEEAEDEPSKPEADNPDDNNVDTDANRGGDTGRDDAGRLAGKIEKHIEAEKEEIVGVGTVEEV